MIKILVISDTHHNYQIMGSVLEIEKHAGVIFHLGDEHDDLDMFFEYTEHKNIYTVPGIYHPDYLNKPTRRCISFSIENWDFQMAHAPKDLNLSDNTIDLFLHGHTHKPEITMLTKACMLNPGHLKAPMDRGFVASYMIIELQPEKADVFIKDLQHTTIQHKTIIKNEY